ncbi:peptidoglycan-binding domain-containing protein [Streptomyces sp. NPDC056528]|uniref:peptidoglycan-binding domain-containing protein n=1 Tax=Streptomyces sp. NPDC056528 TaxID=3345854 RepID=UPI003693F145
MPLPLMLAGALSAGLGAAVAVWSSAEPDSAPASNPSVSLPELATRAPSPARDTAPGPPPGPGASTARTTPPASLSTVPSVSGAPSSGAATDSPTATTAPTTTASPATPTATSSPPRHRHRSPRPGRGEDGRGEDGWNENGWDEDRRGEDRRGDVARGSTGPGVVDLQHRLQQLQLYLGPADGVFGESVEVALRRYQAARNIPQENGVYGPLTRAVLRAETD